MRAYIDKKVLITTQGWFYGADGKTYRAVWGTLKAVHEASKDLGFVPNRAHANWYVEVGSMIIMGCQVMYCALCEEKPNTGDVEDYVTGEKGIERYSRPCQILILE